MNEPLSSLEMSQCEQLMATLATQNSLYQPGPFWQEASKVMMSYLQREGFEGFRHLPASLWFFVPTYGFPGNALSDSQMKQLNELVNHTDNSPKQTAYLEQFVSGYSAALADYRTLSAIEYRNKALPNLLSFSESPIGEPKEQFEFDGNRYSRSALNYLMGLAFLKQYADLTTLNTVLEIGGGFGTLGEISHQLMPTAHYINIDIPPVLCCSTYYLGQLLGDTNLTSYTDVAELDQIPIHELKKMAVLPSWTIEKLQGKVDLFVNFISFQEMEPDIVRNYLNHVNRLGADWVLLRNMREGKATRHEQKFGVETPILSDDYKLMLTDYHLIDVNVVPFGFKTVDGFHSELMLFKRNGV